MKIFWAGFMLLLAGLTICLAQVVSPVGPALSGYSPPAAAVCTPNTQGGGTISNTVFLFHFDNNGTDSVNGHNGVLDGTGSYSSTQSKFGGFAYKGASASDFRISTALAANSGDFTFDWWAFFTSIGTWNTIADQGTTFLVARYNGVSGATYEAGGPGTFAFATAYTPPTNTWVHQAWVRASNVHTFYAGGVAQAMSGTNWATAIGNGSAIWIIGNLTTSGGGGYAMANGYFDEFRYSNNARYSGTFTPPTSAYCNAS